MANAHFGNLADVFKHLALSEVLATARPGEYWESHAGAAAYPEIVGVPPERAHGVHTFLKVAEDFEGLRCSPYHRVLSMALRAPDRRRVPGSPMLARLMLGEQARRLLFCDVDAESLQTISEPMGLGNPGGGGRNATLDKVECVQDDGVSVLRGAGVMLSDQWTASTLAFVDPYEIEGATDAEISPLELSCELANRGIGVMLRYGFGDETERTHRRQQIGEKLEKARLTKRGGQRFEGSLKATGEGKTPTQWGWGLLMLNIKGDVLERVDQSLKGLAVAYEKSMLEEWAGGGMGSGAWNYVRSLV